MASPNEIIPISFQSNELLNDTDICCPVKKPPTPVKRVTRRTAQPGEVALKWPLTGETRRPEHVPQHQHQQPQPHKLVVQAEIHAAMEPPEPEVPNDAQKTDEPLDQVKHPPTPEDPVEQKNRDTRAIAGTYSNSTTKTNSYLRFYQCPDLCHCLMQYIKYLINPFHIKV